MERRAGARCASVGAAERACGARNAKIAKSYIHMTNEQFYLLIGIPVMGILLNAVAVLTGILINNSRLNDTNARVAEVKTDILAVLRAEMKSMEAIMDARLSRIEETLRIR